MLIGRDDDAYTVNAVLNETTETVHRGGPNGGRTACGATSHVDDDRLRTLPLDRAIADHDASRCGRCFADAGGY